MLNQINLSELSSAPWIAEQCSSRSHDINTGEPIWHVPEAEVLGDGECGGMLQIDAEFIALARNAHDVMLRRKWLVGGDHDERVYWPMDVRCRHAFIPHWKVGDLPDWNDPYIALVEADKWFAKNVDHHSKKRTVKT